MISAKVQPQKQAQELVYSLSSPLLILLLALALLLAGSWLAFNQQPHPDPYQPKSLSDKFLYPIESNAFQRLAKISTDLQSVFSLPDSQLVWAVGSNGLIIHSSDGGITWRRQQIPIERQQREIDQTGQAIQQRSLLEFFLSNADAGMEISKTAPPDNSNRKEGRIIQLLKQAQEEKNAADGGQQPVKEKSPDDTVKKKRPEKPSEVFAPVLQAVFFIDTERGWIVGDKGTILHTSDGGTTWRRQKSPVSETLFSVAFSDAQRGWAVGENGVILHTVDGGNSWLRQTSGIADALHSVVFSDAQRGWIAGNNGTIMYTVDAGDSWQKQNSGTKKRLASITFIDARHGWAAGAEGTILQTRDAGMSWQKRKSGVSGTLLSVAFIDRLQGWVVGKNGVVLHTADGGVSWQRKRSVKGQELTSVVFADAGHGWAVGDRGVIPHSTDGGFSWMPQSRNPDHRLAAVDFINRQLGWAVGSDGTILHSTDGGVTWLSQNSQTDKFLASVSFSDARKGWVVGENGLILHSEDGGASWQRQDSGTLLMLNSIQFNDVLHGWAAGAADTILYTADGGKTWKTPDYKRYPAGWYYLLCLMVLGFTGWALTIRQKQEIKQETIAELLASDRPLQSGDPDPLGFTDIARGLSRFLRNPRTEPPLTIAITGEWGTGKSSLMNLLYEDLRNNAFSTVWFNAWHHQKSEQLLATLFANIRRQAIPGWLHVSGIRPVGLLFRLRLLLRRSRRHWLIFLLMVFFFSATAAYIFEESGHFNRLMGWLYGHLTELSRQLQIVFALGATGATLLPLFIFFKSLQGFALNPLKLMTVRAGEGLKATSIDPGARYQFAREFRDVTSSLDLGRMIIFIDDLDRCSKENVLEVLEAINFLVTSGNCYIILGMAREWVQICVGLGFRELATESFSKNHDDAGIDPVEHRRRFAMQYLEKMINIEVPVPVPVLDESNALKLTLPERKRQDFSTFDKIQFSVSRYLENWPMLAFIMMIVLGGYLGLVQELPTAEKTAEQKQQPEIIAVWPAEDLQIMTEQGTHLLLQRSRESAANANAEDISGKWQWVLQGDRETLEKGLVMERFAEGKARLLLRKISERVAGQDIAKGDVAIDSEFKSVAEIGRMMFGEFAPGAENQISWPGKIPYVLLFMVLLAGWILLFRKPDRIVEDSKSFRDALQIWQEWLLLRKQTPRTIKRFLNHLRYVAMRYRVDDEPHSLWQRWRWSRRRYNKEQTVFPEPALVALSILHYIEPSWVSSPEKFKHINQQDVAALLDDIVIHQDSSPAVRDRIREQLVKTVQAHKKAFQVDVLATDAQRELFLTAVTHAVISN